MDEEIKNQINYGLAVMFTTNMLLINGLSKTLKEIDQHEEPQLRIYFRSLVNEAMKTIKKEGLKIKN